jgi:menaquinone-9 beta-reductase
VISLRAVRPFDCDVAVVGAGPAGASTAAHLSRSGLSVWLLDQKRFPRDKVCGDLVGPVALAELAGLGLDLRPDYGATNQVRRAALAVNGEVLITSSLPEVGALPPFGRVVPRLELDTWIVDAARAAGARLLEGQRAARMEHVADGVSLGIVEGRSTRSIRTRVVIGADGSTSRTAEWLRGRPLDKRRRMIAVRAYYDGVEGPSDRADLYFAERSFPGYFWIFPTGGGRANVGIGTVLRTAPPSADHLRDLLLALVREDRAIARRLGAARLDGKVVGWPLTTFDHRLPIVGDRMVLVGDAAGLINPLNGEGIQYALLAGRWAAHVVAQALRRGDCSSASLSPYARTVANGLRYDMALAQMIVELIRNRSLNAVWLRSLKVLAARARADPAYARIAGGVLAGLLPASDLVSRRVLLGSLEQTAIMLDAGSLLSGTHRLLRDAVHHPGAMLAWVAGLAPAAAEVLVCAADRTLGQAAPDPASPAIRPAEGW